MLNKHAVTLGPSIHLLSWQGKGKVSFSKLNRKLRDQKAILVKMNCISPDKIIQAEESKEATEKLSEPKEVIIG